MQSAGLQSQVIFRIAVVKKYHQSDIIAEVLRRGHVQVPQEYVQVEVLTEDELNELSFWIGDALAGLLALGHPCVISVREDQLVWCLVLDPGVFTEDRYQSQDSEGQYQSHAQKATETTPYRAERILALVVQWCAVLPNWEVSDQLSYRERPARPFLP